MNFLKYASGLLVAVVLTACGGGGGNPGTVAAGGAGAGAGGTPVTPASTVPTVSIELRNAANAATSVVSALDIFTLRATVKDPSGVVVAGQIVTFGGDAGLVKFSPANGTGLTDASGVASVQVSPAVATSSGAGNITADVSVAGTAANQASLGVQVVPLATGGAASITLAMRDPASAPTSTIAALDTNTLRATVKDALGNLLPAQNVTFSSSLGLAKFSPAASALTDLFGVASVNVVRSLSTSVGTDVISASVTVGGVPVTPATLNAYVSPLVNGGVPTMSLGLRDLVNASTTTASRSATTFAQVQLRDATGVAPLPTVVTLSGDATLINFPFGPTGLTDNTGIARIPITVVPASTGGASTLRATATVSASPVSASFDYQVPAGAAAGVPTITLGLNGGGNSITASGFTLARATVKDASGVAVAGKLVSFTGNATLIKFSPASGQVLTDAAGVASVQVSPASLSSAGASTLVAQTTVGITPLSSSFDFQLADANLGLQTLSLGAGSLAAFGNRPISVVATINGVPATNTPVQVTFNASCGTVTPSTLTTDASGTASTTYSASLATCAGTNVTVNASAVGATSLSGTIAVASSIATNVQFISTTPSLIFLKDSVGTTQAQVVFRVVDSGGNPLQNKKLSLSLSNTATGVSLNTVGNSAPVELTTDSSGQVVAAVFSGTVPTSLNVKATLVDNPSVFSNSNILAVAVGRATQRSLSLSLEKFSIEGMFVDGETSGVALAMADRQGNPVAPGTQVNFVTESGVMLPPVCFVDANSSCSVSIRSQGTRTVNGRVSLLAYLAGEEDFVDINGNNVFDCAEPFTDLGRAFRDDNAQALLASDAFEAGEFQVPRVASASLCPVIASVLPAGAIFGVPGTGDGVWGAADVRQQSTIIFASGESIILGAFQSVLSPVGINVSVTDINGNSVPTGSSILATAVDRTSGNAPNNCIIAGPSSVTVPNRYGATFASFGFTACATGDVIQISVTTPRGTVTSTDFAIP